MSLQPKASLALLPSCPLGTWGGEGANGQGALGIVKYPQDIPLKGMRGICKRRLRLYYCRNSYIRTLHADAVAGMLTPLSALRPAAKEKRAVLLWCAARPHPLDTTRTPFLAILPIRQQSRATRTPRSGGAAPPSAKWSRSCGADELRVGRSGFDSTATMPTAVSRRDVRVSRDSCTLHATVASGSWRFRGLVRVECRGPCVAYPAIAISFST